jgi:hypothetical protein
VSVIEYPAPDQCWLADRDDDRYVSELRVVAVERSRRFRAE